MPSASKGTSAFAIRLFASFLFASLLAPARARADDTGIAADRFVPAPDARGFIGVEGAENAPPWSAAASLSYATHLIRVTNHFTSDRLSEPLSSVLAVDAGAQVSLTPRFTIGIGVPLALRLTGDRLSALGDSAPLQSPILGDLRLRARALLYGRHGGPYHLAAAAVATFPAGGETTFFATSRPTLEPRLIAELTLPFLRIAALAGYRIAPERHLLNARFGSELHLALAADAHLPSSPRHPLLSHLHVLAEIEANTLGGESFLEVRAALRLTLPHVTIDTGFGAGTLASPTNPAYRVFVILRTGLFD